MASSFKLQLWARPLNFSFKLLLRKKIRFPLSTGTYFDVKFYQMIPEKLSKFWLKCRIHLKDFRNVTIRKKKQKVWLFRPIVVQTRDAPTTFRTPVHFPFFCQGGQAARFRPEGGGQGSKILGREEPESGAGDVVLENFSDFSKIVTLKCNKK